MLYSRLVSSNETQAVELNYNRSRAIFTPRVCGILLLILGGISVGWGLIVGLVIPLCGGSLRPEQSVKPITSTLHSCQEHLEIPRLGKSILIGVGESALTFGVAHMPWSARLGEAGSMVLAGHRDTFFRPLEYVRLGDDLKITCPHRSWKFKVFSIYVTRPGDELRTYPSPDAVLTLVTCYPFRYVGPAPQRLIVSARAVK